jgi:POT family proton-dependent oligopeptide transporter
MPAAAVPAPGTFSQHPKGLYVLFATELWERFSYYSMLALFALYLRDPVAGFGWTADKATKVYSIYLALVYFTPLIGGYIADRKLGYRNAVLLGGVFFMAGHLLLSFKSVEIMYVALACLIIGNGFFKPNVSAMVGKLYPEGSPLKDRAYNIFYMGINVGAFLAPVVAEVVKQRYGFHPAFAVAAGGMLISVLTLWTFRRHVDGVDVGTGAAAPAATASRPAAPEAAGLPIDRVPDSRRIGALVVIFLIVIAFWMAFHQNGSTWTYWANDNTDWSLSKVTPVFISIFTLGLVSGKSVSGVISNAINPFFVILLTFPLIWAWSFLGRRGKEPSTPAKMGIGMLLVALAYWVMHRGGLAGGDLGKVSPWWLIGGYGVLTLGELMLSPMGLALVSKVAPVRLRGMMMGGWFAATAVGNYLVGVIGQYWDDWPHSQFFLVISVICAVVGVLLFALLKPLKRWMPGI